MMSGITGPEFRAKMYAVERDLAALPQVTLGVEHHFADGLYTRVMRIPAGVVLTGAVHLRAHMCIVLAGRIAVLAEDGNWVEFKAGDVMVGAPGSKRIGYAHEDTVWASVHACAATTVEGAEAELVRLDHDGTPYNAGTIQVLIEENRKCLLNRSSHRRIRTRRQHRRRRGSWPWGCSAGGRVQRQTVCTTCAHRNTGGAEHEFAVHPRRAAAIHRRDGRAWGPSKYDPVRGLAD